MKRRPMASRCISWSTTARNVCREIERALKKAGIEYRSIRIAPARMEEAFISLIRKMEAE